VASGLGIACGDAIDSRSEGIVVSHVGGHFPELFLSVTIPAEVAHLGMYGGWVQSSVRR
jgi:hypothetical protein